MLFSTETRHDGLVAALFPLINNINIAMRREFSGVTMFEREFFSAEHHSA